MAHNIEEFEDGTAAFFSNREVAWHKLGVITDGAQTADEALKIAQLGWEVFKSEKPVSVIVPDKNGNWSDEDGKNLVITSKDKFATYRYHPKSGKPEALGVVGSRWTPVQNAEAFQFLNDLADESGAVFETAGSLNRGAKVFMTMKMPDSMNIGGVDKVDTYLMAWNTHDGSTSFNVVVTPIRVVCSNTLAMAISDATNTFTARHTANVGGKIQMARETLSMTFKYVEEFEAEAEALISQSMTDNQFKKLIEQLIPLKEDESGATITSGRALTLADTTRATISALWKAPTQANIAGTKWAAYNAVAEYADWARPIRAKDESVARATRIITGKQNKLKSKVLSLLG